MQLLSYRGPSAAGGISSALNALWNNPASNYAEWWHLANGALVKSVGCSRQSTLQTIPEDAVDAHYRFCNEFIWPLVHGFPEKIAFSPRNKEMYSSLQERVLQTLVAQTEQELFIHDYQFALMPSRTSASTFFWHIVWPSEVPEEWQPYLHKLATGIAGASKIGFHTTEYAENFLNALDDKVRKYVEQKVFVSPLPIDFELWQARASEPNSALPEPFRGLSTPFVLSVDRADYTKGIIERLRAIDLLFETQPELRGKITFVQLCQRTRTEIAAFANYWTESHKAHEQLNQKWSHDGWTPSKWVDSVFSADQLAVIYKHAHALLISSLADGLNLTAKEYVACQLDRPGILLLSRGAGVSQQLGEHAYSFDARNIRSIASAVADALSQPKTAHLERIGKMQKVLGSESLVRWSDQFAPGNLSRIFRQRPDSRRVLELAQTDKGIPQFH